MEKLKLQKGGLGIFVFNAKFLLQGYIPSLARTGVEELCYLIVWLRVMCLVISKERRL